MAAPAWLAALEPRAAATILAQQEAIAGQEAEPRPLDHPLVGRLRCGEWLLFIGVHDLMQLRQLHGLRAGAGASVDG